MFLKMENRLNRSKKSLKRKKSLKKRKSLNKKKKRNLKRKKKRMNQNFHLLNPSMDQLIKIN